ncbi:MAG: glycosyltransferase [Ruminococcaceae bacterium]|nr:glycosyltransferase [Oscillospiraceae bacterium]
MTVELLISTMHQTDHTLLEKMKVSSDAVVVNQCDREGRETFDYNGYRIVWIDTTDRGLSKSRNMAIANATADICMLADDDMEYRGDYVSTVLDAFSQLDGDIISFQVQGIEKPFKNYSPEERKVNFLQSMKISSVEIAFRRDSFAKKEIRFDEMIGAGTEFLMGEENVMLFQCLKKGLKICYTPKEIADLHIGDSTWFKGFNKEYFIGRGAAFTAMQTPFTWLLIWQWAIRKRGLYRQDVAMLAAIKWMNQGKKKYRRKVRG